MKKLPITLHILQLKYLHQTVYFWVRDPAVENGYKQISGLCTAVKLMTSTPKRNKATHPYGELTIRGTDDNIYHHRRHTEVSLSIREDKEGGEELDVTVVRRPQRGKALGRVDPESK